MSIKCNTNEAIIKNTKKLLIDKDLQNKLINKQKKYINRSN